jgi:hypothetical protein
MGKSSTFKDTRDTIDFFKDRFTKNVVTSQNNMWKIILNTIKKLETDNDGNILTTNKNLKILRTLRGDIKRTIITPEYKKAVSRYLNGFNELKSINDFYYKAIASGTLNANKYVFREVLNSSIDATKNSLLDSGITESIIKPVENILSQNVTTGASFQDLTESLRGEILGDKDRLGKLERYSKQITTDSLNQFNANYNQTVSQDLGMEFYYYNGAIKNTSREYCKHVVKEGRYFHKKEVEKSASKEWSGKIPGTTSSNIFVYRGGYNCGHQWLAVATDVVPQSAKDRAESKGYYKPNNN